MTPGAALLRTWHVERESNPDPRARLAPLSESFTPPVRSHPPEIIRYPHVLLAVCRAVETISSYSAINPIHDPAGSKTLAVGGRHPRIPKTGHTTTTPARGRSEAFLKADHRQTSSQNTPPASLVHDVSDRHFTRIDHLKACKPHHRSAPSITRAESRASSPTEFSDQTLRNQVGKSQPSKNMLCPYVTFLRDFIVVSGTSSRMQVAAAVVRHRRPTSLLSACAGRDCQVIEIVCPLFFSVKAGERGDKIARLPPYT